MIGCRRLAALRAHALTAWALALAIASAILLATVADDQQDSPASIGCSSAACRR